MCFSKNNYRLLLPMIALLNLFKDHVRIYMIFHIHYFRIKTRNSSTGITVPEYPNLERGIQKNKMLNEGGMVAAVVGAFGASGALAYLLYHPHKVNHPRCCTGWSIWGLRSTGLFPVPSTPSKTSQVLQWLEHLGLQEHLPISCTIHTR